MTEARALFVSQHDPGSIGSWSGTPFHMLAAFQRAMSVDAVQVRSASPVRAAGRAVAVASRSVVEADRFAVAYNSMAARVHRALERKQYSLLISNSTIPLTGVERSIPSTVWTDATYVPYEALYHASDRTLPLVSAIAKRQERRALQSLSLGAFSSRWAEAGANLEAPGLVTVLAEFGPNLAPDAISRVRRRRDDRGAGTDRPSMLWIGVDWDRKGGDVALEVLRTLRSRGVRAGLTTIGAGASSETEGHRHLGRLSKSSSDDQAALEDALVAADLLLVPSRADCTPIVVSEAAAVGLPVIVTEVGGLGEMVRRHQIGEVVEPGPELESSLADAVERVLDAPKAFSPALDRASQVLNYDASVRRILQGVEAL